MTEIIFGSSKDTWPHQLRVNESILSEEEKLLAITLIKEKQHHLFEKWDSVGINDDKKHEFFNQIRSFDVNIAGGLVSYLNRAKKLLESSKNNENSMKGYKAVIPSLGTELQPLSSEFHRYEEIGMNEISKCGFVLVAGGLGERLGYNGIKVELPVETTTHTSYLELYCKQILAFQAFSCRYEASSSSSIISMKGISIDRSGNGSDSIPLLLPVVKKNVLLPLVIMVSDDTLDKTVKLLEKHSYYGLKKEQVTILKQSKVPALMSNDAQMVLKGNHSYVIDSKPHGHGDIHSLMYSSSTASQWFDNGVQWCVFFQDTNGLAFNSLIAMIGVSKQQSLEVNTLAVPRKAKQAMGALATLVKVDSYLSSKKITVNIEYNQLDTILRSCGYPDGDVDDDDKGRSIFPGNTNQLVFRMEPYLQNLKLSQGIMPEFVNPKYTDNTRAAFKSATRLECMMQDYPKLLRSRCKVGYTLLPTWFSYSPCKNNVVDAANCKLLGIPSNCAFTAESDQYYAYAQILRLLSIRVVSAAPETFMNITAVPGPRVVLDPSFAILMSDIKSRFPTPDKISISSTSTLIVKGDVVIHSLLLDGSVTFIAVPGSRLIVRCNDSDVQIDDMDQHTRNKLTVRNNGHVLVPVAQSDAEIDTIRGYKIHKVEESIVSTEAIHNKQSASGSASVIEYVYTGKRIVSAHDYYSSSSDSYKSECSMCSFFSC